MKVHYKWEDDEAFGYNDYVDFFCKICAETQLKQSKDTIRIDVAQTRLELWQREGLFELRFFLYGNLTAVMNMVKETVKDHLGKTIRLQTADDMSQCMSLCKMLRETVTTKPKEKY